MEKNNIPKIGSATRQDNRRRSAVNEHKKRRAVLREKRQRMQKWQRHKLPIIAVFFAFALVLLLWEISRLQSFAGDAHAVRTLNQVITHHAGDDRTVINPNRGTITDRNMQALATSSTVFNVFVDVRMLDGRSEAEIARVRRTLTEFFEISTADFAAMTARDPQSGALLNDVHYFVIEREVPHTRVVDFEAWLDSAQAQARANDGTFLIRDIHFEETSVRNYIHNTLAANVIGFSRGVWWGLEGHFDRYLTGIAGRTLTTFDPTGSVVRDRIAPIHGATIVTTIDLAIQRFAEDVASRWAYDFSATHASVIVMQPFTGEIIAMAQYPGFDANHPADIDRLTSPRNIDRLTELDPSSDEFFQYLFGIWENFNVTSSFEPGSIYKPFTVAKALEEGVISRNQTFYCPGFKYVAGHRIHCARTWGHGLIDLTTALAVSCNVAHMDIAELLGRDLFWQYQRDFGYGVTTGIDFPGESAGRVFDLAALNASELATSSFGQRFEATPIQNISSFAALINGGHIVRPHLVSQIIGQDGDVLFSARPVIDRQVISRDTSDWMRRAMEYVITEGTGGGAAIEGFAQGGKTGTAEQGVQGIDPDFAWAITYTGYFPIENPQYLIFVAVHGVPNEVYEARVGQRSTAPMYREIAQEIIRVRGMAPTFVVENPGLLHENEFIENFVGMTVHDAVARLHFLGIDYDFIGTGGNIIFSQFPTAGSRAVSRDNLTMMLSVSDNGAESLVDVPDVTGQHIDFAQEVLRHIGLTPRIVYEFVPDNDIPHSAIVFSQSTANIRLPVGTEILLHAGQSP